ncbi:MAG: PPC domain-containing protein, partial [Planctomycetes bacterium]|nr:PPC domain-containing protein [Planctomycetota bacterium]
MAVLALMFCGGPSLAVAQPKPAYSVSSTHVFPAGGRRGTTLELRVGAECLPPHSNFIMFGDGVKARRELSTRLSSTGEPSPRRAPTETPITYPKEWQSQVTIAADAPLGPAFWRVSCASGGTGSRPFIIGDLPEFIERESNSTLSRAEQIKLPITINGRIHGERDVDYFRFQLDAGQTVVVDVIAQRLGSRLDPIVELLDPNETAVNARLTHIGNDPQLQFTASAAGEFILRVANVTFHGSPAHVYRINLTFDRANNARNTAVLNEREP